MPRRAFALAHATSTESLADANLPRTRDEQQSMHGASRRRAPGQSAPVGQMPRRAYTPAHRHQRGISRRC